MCLFCGEENGYDEVRLKHEIRRIKRKDTALPAEDVLSALIARFGFKSPNLFSNPIQYYIDLIDGFLPEKIEIFPTKSWSAVWIM